MSAGPIQLSDEERRLIVASLQRSRENGDYALMEMHPNHPLRGALVLERQMVDELLKRLSIEE
jgi:hypothetical protein